MLHVVLWKWSQPNVAREPYTAEHVNVAARMMRRALPKTPHRIILITDDPWGQTDESLIDRVYDLWPDCSNIANATKLNLPSCYRRLKLYDPATQAELGIAPGDRILGIDLDMIVLRPLDDALKASEHMDFMGWALPGEHHPKVFNGSLQLFTASKLSDIWSEFSEKDSPRAAFKAGFRGSDQSWLSWRLVNRERCDGFGYPLIASYGLHVRKLGEIKRDTAIVFFHGHRKPWHPEMARESAWLAQQWR